MATERIQVEGWNNLRAYDPDSKCSKCGHDSSESNYREVRIATGIILVPKGSVSVEELEREWSGPAKIIEYNSDFPVPKLATESIGIISRECRRCGYTWDERPLDEEPHAQEI